MVPYLNPNISAHGVFGRGIAGQIGNYTSIASLEEHFPAVNYNGEIATVAGVSVISNGVSWGLNSAAPRLKNASTRCFPALTRQAGLQTLNARSILTARSTLIYPEITLGNFYMVNAGETNNAGAGQIDVYIEYPLGSTPVRSIGNTAAAGLVAFPVGLSKHIVPTVVPEGAEYGLCIFQSMGGNGTVYTQVGGGYESAYSTHPLDRMDFSATNNAGNPSAIGAANGTTFFPLAVKTITNNRSVFMLGDSRGSGGDAGVTDASCNLGMPARILGLRYGYTNWAIAATLLQQWNAGSHTYFNQMLAEGTWDVGFTDYGINDAGNGADGATIATRRATCAAALKAVYPTLKLIGGTLFPYVSSSDVFITKANQTAASVNNLRVIDVNGRIRAGIVGEDSCWDQADYITPFRDGTYPVSRNQNDITVTPVTLTGGISATTLTVTAIGAGVITAGMPLYNAASLIRRSTWVVRQLTGTTGSTGTYEVSKPHSGFPYMAVVPPGTAISSAGFATADGLHLQWFGEEMGIRAGGPALLALAA